ncbi:hypothetical protein P5G51_001250 [Virgibacillus sp. 179-BFC.A HS]|uniref:Membrane-spanning protein n=1 Tax=Tigheibacillus jepli TaxID=3035914 RepID=A0ABU5CFB9_9BACI|nr:hypothetical protein [Virgibacillus sp. 179-BFC.A HS]MDY0404215.1 hypothetical protein [Virgibacillus sp. 179-BFC.A HS]
MMTWGDKVKRKFVIAISLAYTIFMAILAVYFFNGGEKENGWVGIGGVICGAIPLALSLFTKLKFHLPIVISYIIFLFGSQYLGSIRGWYGLGWWDTFIHFISGGMLAFVAVALYERLIYRSAGDAISPWVVFLFVLGIGALGGVLWEFYEFTGDQFFHMTMQGGGNFDTMTDLLAGMLGTLIVASYSGIRTKMKQKQES